MRSFEIRAVQERLAAGSGGYEIVHESPGLEIGVYVLVAPEPDRQQPHSDDEVYVVLEGSGRLEVEDEETDLREGDGVFVPAGADHRFTGYEHLSLLVVFDRRYGSTSSDVTETTPGPGLDRLTCIARLTLLRMGPVRFAPWTYSSSTPAPRA